MKNYSYEMMTMQFKLHVYQIHFGHDNCDFICNFKDLAKGRSSLMPVVTTNSRGHIVHC